MDAGGRRSDVRWKALGCVGQPLRMNGGRGAEMSVATGLVGQKGHTGHWGALGKERCAQRGSKKLPRLLRGRSEIQIKISGKLM